MSVLTIAPPRRKRKVGPADHGQGIESTAVWSMAGALGRGHHGLLRARPFRAPHHTVSDAGLVGGGAVPGPGELSLAYQGVLFLDELPEFRRSALQEALRTAVMAKVAAAAPGEAVGGDAALAS